MEKKVEVKSGCGLWSLGCFLTILFVILKFAGVIGWSWLWVLSPLWIAIGVYVLVYVLIIGFLIGVVGVLVAAMKD